MKPKVLFSIALALILSACERSKGSETPVSQNSGSSSPTENFTNIASGPVSECDVIVVGGSTAALGAALSAAKEFQAEAQGRIVCLTEPTNWLGGQLTAAGVTAVDWAHHKTTWNGKTLNLSKLSRRVENNSREFSSLMEAVAPSRNGVFEMAENPGKCWVSVRCYEPNSILLAINNKVNTLVQSGNLRVFLRTVPKSVGKTQGAISSVNVIRRTPVHAEIDEERLSQVIVDWYTPSDSPRFRKEFIALTGRAGKLPVVVEATDWGEILVLAGASFMQGVESGENVPEATNNTCGQAIVYPMALMWQKDKQAVPAWIGEFQPPNPSHYTLTDNGRAFSWAEVWTYRRIKYGSKSGGLPPILGVESPSEGDISEQNWTMGNDYPYGYLFRLPTDARAQVADWMGGVDISVLAAAEAHAVGWYSFMRNAAPEAIREKIIPAPVLGTRYGFSKIPYIRDTRRSIGVGNFVMKYAGEAAEGFQYPDSIGVGTYVADVHATKTPSCFMPPHMSVAPTPKPFYLALRAHTNRDVGNLLVAGKTMAQTFLLNAATRLHPIEFASGTGAGVAAALMASKQMLSSAALVKSNADVAEIQRRIEANHGTITWRSVESALE